MHEPVIWMERAWAAAFRPRPIERLAFLRIVLTIAVLGFMSSRIAHADDWLSIDGFRVPPLPDDWRQPATFPGLSVWGAWLVAGGLVVSGLATLVGAATRWSALVFAALLAYVALADRLAAFTVSKLSPILMLAIALSPAGARYSVDAWWRRRRHPDAPVPTHVSGGAVAFFQILLPVFYCSSGIAKSKGDWLSHPYVLWTHLHDSYQTPVSWAIANYTPPWVFTVIQAAVLAFEAGAPLWFGLRWTRPYALAFGVGMHFMIGLMFGPVIWFSLLMISLLVSSYAPERWLTRALTIWRRPA